MWGSLEQIQRDWDRHAETDPLWAILTHPDPVRLAELGRAVADGRLVIPIARRFPLAEVRAAQQFAEQGPGGKVVLVVWTPKTAAAASAS